MVTYTSGGSISIRCMRKKRERRRRKSKRVRKEASRSRLPGREKLPIALHKCNHVIAHRPTFFLLGGLFLFFLLAITIDINITISFKFSVTHGGSLPACIMTRRIGCYSACHPTCHPLYLITK